MISRHRIPARPFTGRRPLLDWRSCVLTLAALSCGGMAHAAAPSSARTTAQLSQALQELRSRNARMVGYDVVFRRDPMRSLIDARGQLVTSAGLGGGLSVQGIIWSEERPLAVIDDALFAAGDTVGAYKILQIRPDGVIAQHGQEALLIPLDRGLQALEEHPMNPLAVLSLPEDVPVPYAPRHRTVLIESGTIALVREADDATVR